MFIENEALFLILYIIECQFVLLALFCTQAQILSVLLLNSIGLVQRFNNGHDRKAALHKCVSFRSKFET